MSRRLIAITREVSSSIVRCQLTHIERAAIDLANACLQHAEYERCLARLGCAVQRLPEAPQLPDSVFVEDAAAVFDDIAVLARPGAASRRAETASVAAALAPHREVVPIEAPGTLDGGDLLAIDRRVFVGRSSRTNSGGVEQLRAILEPRGYSVCAVPIDGCLHLKSAVTRLAPDRLLLNPQWVDASAFGAVDVIDVDPAEPFAANALAVGDEVIVAAAFERTAARLAGCGIRVVSVDVSELAKAEAGVTCCSLVFRS